jgi:hypothetical protein
MVMAEFVYTSLDTSVSVVAILSGECKPRGAIIRQRLFQFWTDLV